MYQDSVYGGIIPEGICLWGQLAPTSELPRPRGSLIHNTAFILKSKNSDSTDQFCSLDRASSSRNLVAACENGEEGTYHFISCACIMRKFTYSLPYFWALDNCGVHARGSLKPLHGLSIRETQ